MSTEILTDERMDQIAGVSERWGAVSRKDAATLIAEVRRLQINAAKWDAVSNQQIPGDFDWSYTNRDSGGFNLHPIRKSAKRYLHFPTANAAVSAAMKGKNAE